MKRAAIILNFSFALICLLSQSSFSQSCGSGKSFFHVFSEDDSVELRKVYISLHVVDANQDWHKKDFRNRGWKEQEYSEEAAKKYTNRKARSVYERAFEIPLQEESRLMQNWMKLSRKHPNSIFTAEKDRCGNWMQGSSEFMNDVFGKPIFNTCTREGCRWMVLAVIQAKDHLPGYFVSDFICGCTKHYEFRLRKRRDKCLPGCEKSEGINYFV